MRRIDLEVNGLSVDALVVSCYPGGLVLDLAPDLGEVVVSPPWDVEKLSPFLLSCNTCWSVGNVHFVFVVGIFAFAGKVDELKDERPPSNNATTSGEEVSADNVLEYR
jgi:hypothetical protein